MENSNQHNQIQKPDLQAALRSIERDRLMDEVGQWENQITVPKKKASNPVMQLFSRYKYGIAAAIVTFIVASQFIPSASTDVNDLARSYLKPYPNVTYPIARSIDNQKLLQYMSAYENGNYPEAAIGLIDHCETPDYKATCFYLAMCYIEMGDWKAAIKRLQMVKNYSVERLDDKIDWYLALCYINLNDKPNAISSLQDVVDNQSYNHEEANELLDKM